MIGYIVEGKSDEVKLRMVEKQAYVVVLNGIQFGPEQREKIEYALEMCDTVYILTDPDSAGDYIAKKIQTTYPFIERIHVNPDEAKVLKKRGYKYGVEHCSNAYLRRILYPHAN